MERSARGAATAGSAATARQVDIRLARRRAIGALTAAGAALLPCAPVGATPPRTASLTARRVAGRKLSATVQASVALPEVNWSGTLGTWHVPERGSRTVSVQPPGVPARCELVPSTTQNSLWLMARVRTGAHGGPWGPGYGYATSARLA